MSNTLSKELLSKGLSLKSMTILSPADRKMVKGDNKGQTAKCTVYFTKWTSSGKGVRKSYKPTKDATLFTKDESDAAAIENCEQSTIKPVKLEDGSSLYFRVDTLSKDEFVELVRYHAKDTVDVVANKILAVFKQATNQAIMALPLEERKKLSNFIGNITMPVINKLESVGKKKASAPRITLWT